MNDFQIESYCRRYKGEPDDTRAVQAAFADASTQGGIITFDARSYDVKPLVLERQEPAAPPVTLHGAGRCLHLPVADVAGVPGTVLRYNWAYGGTMLTLKNLNGGGIHDLVLDGGTQAACGLVLDTGLGIVVRDVQTVRTYSYGLVLQASAAGLYHSRFEGVGSDNGMLLTSGTRNANVAQCTFTRTSLQGSLGLDLADADNCDFFGLTVNGGPILFRARDGQRQGARYIRLFGVDGDAGCRVVHDADAPNLMVGLSHGNGIPGRIEGARPDRLTLVGAM